MQRVFSTEGISPFDQVKWERRTAEIKDDKGNVVFEQTDVRVPKSWDQLATNIVASKYFYGARGSSAREASVRQLVGRVVETITAWGLRDGYFDEAGSRVFHDELAYLCLNQYGAFNSPVWFNVGLHHCYGIKGPANNFRWWKAYGSLPEHAGGCQDAYEYPQGSACFIQAVDDDMRDIMALATSEAMLFKYGSGTGTDLSTLRSSREMLAGGGRPSGPVSFMRIYDAIAATIKSGGKTRRAAKMQTLKMWHPDILEFIQAKTKEDAKAQALIREGYESNFNGEAYSSVCFQNANLSVRATDEFMRLARDPEAEWITSEVTTGNPSVSYKASYLMDQIAEGTWICGDPGMQFEDTVSKWHTCPNSAPINSSNPCSEYVFIDDSACNLASLNLMKFRRDDGTFDIERFKAAVKIFLTAQEILVDHVSYPTRAICENSHKFRPLGLGYANLGCLLMSLGIPYDSEAGRDLAGAITALMHGSANLRSAEMARDNGAFEAFELNREPMLNVMRMHLQAAIDGYTRSAPCTGDIWCAAMDTMQDAISIGEVYGYRNAQVTLLAPTGTIAFMMGCDTTGVEPDIALIKYKTLAGGGQLRIVNRTVPLALQHLGYDEVTTQTIIDYLDANDTIEGAPGLNPEHLPIFDCAFPSKDGGRSIHWTGHVKMLAAAQPFLSGAISKTINLPNDCTPQDIRDAYYLAWELGVKAAAVYRDGSKASQPLNTAAGDEGPVTQRAERERLPDERDSLTHKFDIQGHEGYVTAGKYPDGRLGELFVTMSKEGSTVGGLMDTIGTAVSIGLQYGAPLDAYVRKFAHTRFEPAGFTKNPDIPIAKSITDYIFRWLGMKFIPGYREQNAPKREPETQASPAQGSGSRVPYYQADSPACSNCGAITVRNATCYRCHNCGESMGCS